ncbi:LuxR C-terminal-related transcriptional regulator [Modestobacter sp. I12A-02662]|uniref:LuxR C-terminal-related transcriptional regulator n=1 Tax=Modestobacter sp. I12A-02662 TaxID=1730496 RepID=UPI0034DF8204
MAGPLLATKLHVPRRRPGWVARRRLVERLGRSRDAALTLLSAPAGFGKTTLLTDWLATAPGGRSTAWLSLDARDDDPVLFWTYLVTALDAAVPGVGARALALLQSAEPPVEAVLATVLNDLGAVPDDVVLVLDDFHVIEAAPIEEGMTFLLEHLPPRLHLVIATRADPALPLARWRVRGELVELRAADLRFTPEEAAAYLGEVLGPVLTAADVAALEERTEGWIAALQLAALSLQGRDDVAGFIAGFAGDDRYVLDYLAEEVLQRQPAPVREFLLRTSVLGRLTGPLCDAVTGQDGGRATLEALDRGNLFLVPLDDRRRWYRYHHLFADVLQAHLRDEQPDAVPALHRRAADWFERAGDRAEAVSHALAAGDVARAADLVELALPALRRSRQEVTLSRWLAALPDEVVRARPVLSVGYASALMVRGEVAGVEARLRDAERWLAAGGDPEMVVVDEAAFRALPSAIAVYRAGQALVREDVAGTMAHARRALELAGEDDAVGRGAASALLALAYWRTGDLDAAHRWYAAGAAELERAGHLSDVLGCAIALADIRLAQGRLSDAVDTYEHGLRLSTSAGGPALRGAADMHVGLSEVLRERDDRAAARRHLETSAELGEHVGLPQHRYRSRVAAARLRQADGDLAGAVELLEEAERCYAGDFFPDVRPVAAVRARVEVARGNLGWALGWARQRGLSVDDDPGYLREFEHLTLVRVLLARPDAERDLAGVARLLDRLLRAAEEGQRTGSVIEVLVLQTLLAQARGASPAAPAPLRRALSLAEPEGFVRLFADEGRPLAALLRSVADRGDVRAHARRVLAALDGTGSVRPARPGLVDPLSSRELDVLRLLASDLDGPGIARELFVSLNTVRTHTKAVYAKLGVNNRRAAVRRAAELGLTARDPGHRSPPSAVRDR